MKTFAIATTMTALTAVTSFFPITADAASTPVPCEKMLEQVRAAGKGAQVNEVDKARFSDLQSKGIERSKADDDEGADAIFTEALKIVGK